MKLEQIKDELEKNDFFAGLKNNYILAGFLKDKDNITGIITLSSGFKIFIEEKIKLEYSYGQITKEEFFEEIIDLIDYVKNTFPLKKNISSEKE